MYDNKTTMQAELKDSSCESRWIKRALTGLSASMSSINEVLRDAKFRHCVWESFGIPMDVQYPELPGALMYGDVSSSVHLPNLQSIYVSENDRALGTFYSAILNSLKSGKSVEYYSEADAAWSEDNFGPN